MSPTRTDFTDVEFEELIGIAKRNYAFASYDSIPWSERFVLWRHDVDFSLNRSVSLARIEQAHGITSTYFINIHSEFYNAHERSQTAKIAELVALQRHIGLHLDTAWLRWRTGTERWSAAELDELVAVEARILEDLSGTTLSAVSFHNPSSVDLGYTDETYGGLINCYSQRLKDTAEYCSDSFGYWRFSRLRDVLESADAPALQVLTHPGNWQSSPMRPRERVVRSVYGRADAVIRDHDRSMLAHGGQRFDGDSLRLDRVRMVVSDEEFSLLDQLWNRGQLRLVVLWLAWLLQRVLNDDVTASEVSGSRVEHLLMDNLTANGASSIDDFPLVQLFTLPTSRLADVAARLIDQIDQAVATVAEEQ